MSKFKSILKLNGFLNNTDNIILLIYANAAHAFWLLKWIGVILDSLYMVYFEWRCIMLGLIAEKI